MYSYYEKKVLTKNLWWIKKVMKILKTLLSCWVSDRDCNIKIKSNHKIPLVFPNLQNYDSHLTMQKLGKFNFTINVIPNRLEKYMSFNFNNKLIFIDNCQYLSSSLGSLVKNLSKDDLKHLSQEFDSDVLELVMQKEFYPYEYMRVF